jgi:hypothetical protein
MPLRFVVPRMRLMSYAVVWRENDGPACAGLVELDDRCFELSQDRRVRYCDLADVYLERRSGGSASSRPSLILICHDGTRLQIESLEGLGALHELAGELVEARRKVAV